MPREGLVVEVEVALDHVADDFQLGIAGERNFARKHDVQNDTHGPDVDLLVVLLKENFWSDVVGLWQR